MWLHTSNCPCYLNCVPLWRKKSLHESGGRYPRRLDNWPRPPPWQCAAVCSFEVLEGDTWREVSEAVVGPHGYPEALKGSINPWVPHGVQPSLAKQTSTVSSKKAAAIWLCTFVRVAIKMRSQSWALKETKGVSYPLPQLLQALKAETVILLRSAFEVHKKQFHRYLAASCCLHARSLKYFSQLMWGGLMLDLYVPDLSSFSPSTCGQL